MITLNDTTYDFRLEIDNKSFHNGTNLINIHSDPSLNYYPIIGLEMKIFQFLVGESKTQNFTQSILNVWNWD